MTNTIEKRLYSTKDTMLYLHIGRKKLYEIINHDSDFPRPAFAGWQNLYDKQDLDAWIDLKKQKRPTTNTI